MLHPCLPCHQILVLSCIMQLLGVAVGLVEVVRDRSSGVFTSNKRISFPWIIFQGHLGKESGGEDSAVLSVFSVAPVSGSSGCLQKAEHILPLPRHESH